MDKKIFSAMGPGVPQKKLHRKREREWFEKFRWFYTSEGFLVLGGKDAKTNETIVKKIMQPQDIYFHADIHGAPHVVLKTGGKNPSEASKKEAAVFAASFSSAWREHLPYIDVYSAKPEQLSKKAPSGESIGTGAFMVYGKREWFRKTPLDFALGFRETPEKGIELFPGPESAVRKNSSFYVNILFGGEPKSAAAKKTLKIFAGKLSGAYPQLLDDIAALLPSGNLRVENPRN